MSKVINWLVEMEGQFTANVSFLTNDNIKFWQFYYINPRRKCPKLKLTKRKFCPERSYGNEAGVQLFLLLEGRVKTPFKKNKTHILLLLWTKAYICSDFLSFYLMYFYWSRIPSRNLHYIQWSRLPGLLLAMTVSETVLVFGDLDSSAEDWSVLCPLALRWDLPDILLMLKPGPWVFGRQSQE